MEPMSADTAIAQVTAIAMTTEMTAAKTEVRIILAVVGPSFISNMRSIARSTAMNPANNKPVGSSRPKSHHQNDASDLEDSRCKR